MKRIKSIGIISSAVALIISLTLLVGCGGDRPVEIPPPSSNEDSLTTVEIPEGAETTVTVRVDVTAALESDEYRESVKALSETGELFNAEVSLPADATALDALNATGLAVVTEDSSYGPMITGIGGLSQGDCGAESYWSFLVNGEMADVGANSYVLQAGDTIAFSYALSYDF